MIKNFFDNRAFIIFFAPFLIGSLSVLSFQPFNLTVINFIIFPLFFLLLFISQKNLNLFIEKNPIRSIYSYLAYLLGSVFIYLVFLGFLIL